MIMPFKSILGVLHRAVFHFRFVWRSRAWRPADRRSCPKDTRLLISGFFNEALGIGRASELIADRFEVAGYTVTREDLRPFDRGLATRLASDFAAGITAPIWLIAANPPEARIALFAHNYAAWQDMYRIGLWHWESSIAPSAWIKTACWFHEIWLSSQFSLDAIAEAMRRAGHTDQISKLRVRTLPVKVPISVPARIEKAKIQVLTMFDPRSDFERKNPMAVFKAWLMLFPEPSQTARLIVKSLATAAEHPRFQELQMLSSRREDIRLVAETLPLKDTEALIAESDILISLHRGEGFGLPLAEAMAAGVAVIATGWSGNLQFMTAENAILIPCHLVPAARNYNGPMAKWAEPDIRVAAAALGRLIDDSDLRHRLVSQGRRDIMTLYRDWTAPASPIEPI